MRSGKVFSAATTAASEFRKILFKPTTLINSTANNSATSSTTVNTNANDLLAFHVNEFDLKSALKPLQETLDTSNHIEPTLKHLLSLSLQSKPQINKFNASQARNFFARSENDTGSVEVQCGQLTARIIWLGEHCAQHKHDYTAQRKIVELVAIRRKFLKYLRRVSLQRYYTLLDQLSLPPNYMENFEASCSYKNKKTTSK
jgi:small subunit ribosomal protein S15